MLLISDSLRSRLLVRQAKRSTACDPSGLCLIQQGFFTDHTHSLSSKHRSGVLGNVWENSLNTSGCPDKHMSVLT